MVNKSDHKIIISEIRNRVMAKHDIGFLKPENKRV